MTIITYGYGVKLAYRLGRNRAKLAGLPALQERLTLAREQEDIERALQIRQLITTTLDRYVEASAKAGLRDAEDFYTERYNELVQQISRSR